LGSMKLWIKTQGRKSRIILKRKEGGRIREGKVLRGGRVERLKKGGNEEDSLC